MKKIIMAVIVVASLCLSNVVAAADVVITTGQQGLTYILKKLAETADQSS
ncbi:TPA: hypothetical protein L9S25_000864 [Klebsiella pneumoniae]|nr:hypothetical protein [Klebsiella pneumoniae]